MATKKADHIIENEKQLNNLVSSIKAKKEFANSFAFSSDDLIGRFFQALGINRDDFAKKSYYYNSTRDIHISESQNGFFWISTVGLVSKGKLTNDHFVNALSSQYWVVKTLLEAVDEICSYEQVYSIDSYWNEKIQEITPALFGNMVFFFELFGKAYLSISGKNVSKGHNLSVIYQKVEQTMFEQNHNNTLFHALCMHPFIGTTKYISVLPNSFNEAFIKYDDNNDDTVLRLNHNMNKEWMNIIETCYDFILEFYYCGNNTFYLHTGYYEKLLSKAASEVDKNRIKEQYGFLKGKQVSTTNANS